MKLGKDKFMLPFYYEQKNKYQGLTINISRELEEIIGITLNVVKDGE